jgi:hypothetical protein
VRIEFVADADNNREATTKRKRVRGFGIRKGKKRKKRKDTDLQTETKHGFSFQPSQVLHGMLLQSDCKTKSDVRSMRVQRSDFQKKTKRSCGPSPRIEL